MTLVWWKRHRSVILGQKPPPAPSRPRSDGQMKGTKRKVKPRRTSTVTPRQQRQRLEWRTRKNAQRERAK